MPENLVHHLQVDDEGDDTHLTTAPRAHQRGRFSPACSRSRQRSTAPPRTTHNSFLPRQISIEPRSRISAYRAPETLYDLRPPSGVRFSICCLNTRGVCF
jgi:hypothetical protein